MKQTQFSLVCRLHHEPEPGLGLTGCLEPFTGVDLATIDSATVSALNVMRELAEDAETEVSSLQI